MNRARHFGTGLLIVFFPLVVPFIVVALLVYDPTEAGLNTAAIALIALGLPSFLALGTLIWLDRRNRNPPIEALRSRAVDQFTLAVGTVLITVLCLNRLFDWKLDDALVVFLFIIALSLVNAPGVNWLLLFFRLRLRGWNGRRYDSDEGGQQ